MRNVIMTKHGTRRTWKRCGVKKKSSKKVSEKALEYGIDRFETTGSLRRYLDSIWFMKLNANNLKIYQEKIFLFHDNILVSIFNLPSRYRKTVNKLKFKKSQKM